MRLLLLFNLPLSIASASPIWRHVAQQVLSPFFHQEKHEPQALYKPSSYLDVRPGAVVLALTSGDDEDAIAQYFFLPRGRNVRTRESLC